MSYKNIVNKVNSGFLVLPILTLSITSSLPLPSTGTSIIKESPKEVIDQVWQIIYRDFLDSSGNFDQKEWLNIRNKLLTRSYGSREESYEAIRGMLSSLEDPYTRFLDPKQFKEMRIDTTGELSGVGIQLSLNEKNNSLIVVSPIEGTPAFKAGIKSKDIIISINGTSTINMSIDEAVKLIRGKSGSKIKLGIKRDGELINFTLVRSRIEIKAVSTKFDQSVDGKNIGYIRIKQFNANAAREMRESIKKLEKNNIIGYIIDLRSNPGGLLEVSVDIARQILNKGIIVSTLTKNGIKDIRRANGQAITNLPIVVLVNQGSASASEILSGAIKDNNRGILIGQKTFGKGLVQSVRALNDGSGLTVTIAKYLTPNGSDINKFGIDPNIFFPIDKEDLKTLTPIDLATKRDKHYIKAINTLIKITRPISSIKVYNPKKEISQEKVLENKKIEKFYF